MTKTIKIFYSYSHLDVKYLEKLKKSLSILRRQGIIEDWGDRDINAGEDWKKSIDIKLEQAQIVVLLVSTNFLASDYCYDYEMKRALIKHKLNLTKVIPIILTDSEYQETPFSTIEVLPEKGFAVDNRQHWPNANYAYTNIARGIRKVTDNISHGGFVFNRSDVTNIMDMTENQDLKQYAIEKLKIKLIEVLRSDQNGDDTQVYWFMITLAEIGDPGVEVIIKEGMNSTRPFIVQGAIDALEILKNKSNI